ncbi:IS1595 family transposase [Paenibacillus sp.]|uniref:IS1595 family transposase n=1 Tax=Paenibacillus sp. TaxID=58172 RepID=UPI002D566824|nr:IS1595 family transposase [Paenibacillus sp.]HZG84431.1 IS1595 family transposase [Paenibacillus sp.]
MEDIISFFFRRKWPNGFRCPRCFHTQAYSVNTRRLPLFECKACSHQTSLTAGTILEGTRTPLHKWAEAMRLVSCDRSINAVQLASQIQVTYKTAWAMLMKIRKALSAEESQTPLQGRVSCSVAFYGRRNCHYIRHPQEHAVLVAMGTTDTDSRSMIKFQYITPNDMIGKRLRPYAMFQFAQQHTKSCTEFRMLNRIQYYRSFVLPVVFEKVKTWINKTFRGIGPKYLQYYLDEHCFRQNKASHGANIFDSLAMVCLRTPKSPLLPTLQNAGLFLAS